MKPAVFLLVALVCVLPAAARAQDDVEGSKDHPLVSRYPGYYIEGYDQQDFGAFEFPLASGNTQRVEGRYWEIRYALKEGVKKAGPLQISRNYTNLFEKRGGTKLTESVDAGGGTASARLKAGAATVWLNVDIVNGGEGYVLTIVEEAALEQKVEFTAAALAAALADKGSVALRGIQFETGKAAITPDSAATLAQVGELLKNDASLKLEIQGHTDSAGNPAGNLKLSQERAAAVKAYLVSNFGIAADRLTTSGLGDTRPVADNATEAGRAQNRRVELVKK